MIDPELLERAVAEVDRSLLEWFRSLPLRERLRSMSRLAAQHERMRRALSADR